MPDWMNISMGGMLWIMGHSSYTVLAFKPYALSFAYNHAFSLIHFSILNFLHSVLPLPRVSFFSCILGPYVIMCFHSLKLSVYSSLPLLAFFPWISSSKALSASFSNLHWLLSSWLPCDFLPLLLCVGSTVFGIPCLPFYYSLTVSMNPFGKHESSTV